MKILAINGSPRGDRGNTERILQSFLEGARGAGAETEVVYLKGKKIKHCRGCFNCWTKTPGVCVHKDDMPELLVKVRGANVLIFATPLYIFTVSGLMKDFMDRIIPLLHPAIIRRGDQYIHPMRYEGGWPGKFVLISNCGFPERHHFSGLEETFRCFTSSPDVELAGMICCAAGELLRQPALQDSLAWYLEAARSAGQEVVEQGRISPKTQAVLDRPLVEDPAVYANAANAAWESMGVEGVEAAEGTPRQTSKASAPLPPPQSLDTMRDLVAGMAMSFDAKAANDLKAVIQFDVTGEEPGQYYLSIADGKCAAFEGTHAKPTLTVHTPADVWMAISRGKMNGATAMMMGKYSVKGNLGLLMRFDKLFSARPEA
jgi:putative sterol carrier protein